MFKFILETRVEIKCQTVSNLRYGPLVTNTLETVNMENKENKFYLHVINKL